MEKMLGVVVIEAVIQVDISSESKFFSPWYKIESLDIFVLMFNASKCRIVFLSIYSRWGATASWDI